MIRFKINQAKQLFFDRRTVMSAKEQAEKRVLSRFGAFVRRTARSSIRNRKRVSRPGQPPSNRTGILKRFIYFVYDVMQHSVLIGPAKTNQVFFNGNGQPMTGTVPEVLEYGGQIGILETEIRPGYWIRADLRSKRRLAGKPKRLRKATIAARPYMTPAFEKERDRHMPAMWRDALR